MLDDSCSTGGTGENQPVVAQAKNPRVVDDSALFVTNQRPLGGVIFLVRDVAGAGAFKQIKRVVALYADSPEVADIENARRFSNHPGLIERRRITQRHVPAGIQAHA